MRRARRSESGTGPGTPPACRVCARRAPRDDLESQRLSSTSRAAWPHSTAAIVPSARNGPNGTAVRRPAWARRQQRHADHGTGEEPEEQPDRDQPRVQPAEVQPQQRGQADVAVAHPAAAGDVHDEHDPERDPGTDQHHPDPPRLVAHERGDDEQRGADRHRDVRDLARQPRRAQVDRRQRDQPGGERREGDQLPRRAEVPGKHGEQCGRRRLKNERFDADGCTAPSAPTALDHPADDRDQISGREAQATRPAR